MAEPTPTAQTLTGSCLCGLLKFTVSGVPSRFYHCHCSRCRKSSGTGHASNLFIEGGKLSWDGNPDDIRSYKLPEAERFTRTFCRQCGGPLPRELPAYNMVQVPAGTLNDEPGISPQAHIFQGSKTSWSCSAGQIPAFSDYPE